MPGIANGVVPEVQNAGVYAGDGEMAAYRELAGRLRDSSIPDNEILGNLELFLTRSSMARIMFIHELYQQILPVHGVVLEFGVRWGRNLALYTTFRSMYEPYNLSRRIIGFDTFEGFPSVAPQDGHAPSVGPGKLAVTEGHHEELAALLTAHEALGARPNVRKFELVKGDVTETLPAYLSRHPETIVALAYFDFDLYAPTKSALALIRDRLVKGSVVAFDELALAEFPGETTAVVEALGLPNIELRRSPLGGYQSYFVVR